MKRKASKSAKNKTGTVKSRAAARQSEKTTVAATAPGPAAAAPEKPVQKIVGAVFQNESDVRAAIAGNLRERSAETMAINARAQQAFAAFNPSKYSSQELPRGNYLKPEDDLTSRQHQAINAGLDTFRNSSSAKTLKLGKSPALQALIKPAPANDESIVGTIALSDLMSYVAAKSDGQSFVARNGIITQCAAEIEAERRLREITDPGVPAPAANAGGAAAGANGKPEETAEGEASTLTATSMVKENVDRQMATATSPESQLRYSVPDRSDQMKNVRHNIDTFELRAGPSDVTSYHDFHNLQIAFEDVWTEIFDAKIGNLGKQLYEEYVRLKSFAGADDGQDHSVNTIDDLRRLMDEIRDFSRITVDSIPTALQPANGANGGGQNNGAGNVVTDVINVVNAVVNPAGALVDFVMKAFSGQEGALTWDSFKTNLPLGDIITFTIEPDKLPKTIVEFVLIAGPNSSGHVGLIYEDKKTKAQWPIQTSGPGVPATLSLASPFTQDGLVHFRRTTSPFIVNGVYNLAIDSTKIKPGSRVTFTWLKDG